MQISADFLLIFVQNIVFQDLLGLPQTAVSVKNGRGFARLGLLTLLFCTVISGLTAMIRPVLPLHWQKLLFPVCCAAFSGLLFLLLNLLLGKNQKTAQILQPFLAPAAFSGAVLGTVLFSTDYTHEAAIAFRYGAKAGCGYLIACLMLKAAAPILYSEKVPAAVRGWKAVLLYAALLSMAAGCMFPA